MKGIVVFIINPRGKPARDLFATYFAFSHHENSAGIRLGLHEESAWFIAVSSVCAWNTNWKVSQAVMLLGDAVK